MKADEQNILVAKIRKDISLQERIMSLKYMSELWYLNFHNDVILQITEVKCWKEYVDICDS